MEGDHTKSLSMGFAGTEKDLNYILSTFVDTEDEINNLSHPITFPWQISRGGGCGGGYHPRGQFQIFTKMARREWLDMKIEQISPQESGSKWKSNTQQEYVWLLNNRQEGVPEVKKGGLNGDTSLLTLTEGVTPPTHHPPTTHTCVMNIVMQWEICIATLTYGKVYLLMSPDIIYISA